jgi:hypothetical protein
VVSIVVNVAATIMAAIPTATADQPNLSSIVVNRSHTIATGHLVMVERGRLRPRRIPGFRPWVCPTVVKAGRRVGCTLSTASHIWSAGVRYTAKGGRSKATVTVRLIAR